MDNKLILNFKPEVAKRFDDYLMSEEYQKELNLLHHWARFQPINAKAFSVKGNNVIIDVDVVLSRAAPDDNYLKNFGDDVSRKGKHYIYNKSKDKRHTGLFAPVRKLKNKYKKKLLHRLGCYDQPAYDPLYHFEKYWPNGKGYFSVEDMKEECGDCENMHLSKWKAFYFYNEIYPLLESENMSLDRVLEIGAGSGSLLKLIKKHNPGVKIFNIDLATSIPYSFCNLLYEFPDSTFLLPNELGTQKTYNIDLVFCSNLQHDLLPKDYFDLAVNTMSFAEMRKDDVDLYFYMLRRCMKSNNLFYCVNRWESKVTEHDEEAVPYRFIDYPWSIHDNDYLFMPSKVHYGYTAGIFLVKATKLKVSH